MNCNRIKELILTDYMDEEAPVEVQNEVKLHLEICSSCRQFEQSLREIVSQPLRKIEAAHPPEEVWQRIKQTIEEEQAEQYEPSLLWRAGDFLRRNFLLKKPALAFSTAVTVILIMVLSWQVPLRRQGSVKDYLQEQSEVMLSLNRPLNGGLEKELNLGTTIEQYLY